MTGFRADIFTDIDSLFIRDAANTLAEIGEVWIRDAGNVLQRVWSAEGEEMVVQALDVFGAVSSKSPRQVTTNPVDITVIGGVAPFTYMWAVDLGWDIYGQSLPNARFTSPYISAGDSASATCTCAVTDSAGKTATVTINAYCDNYGG